MDNRTQTVVFAAPPTFGLTGGGLQVQVRETARWLGKFGWNIRYFDPWNEPALPDLVHVFTLHPGNVPLMRWARDKGIATVLSPVANLFGRRRLVKAMATASRAPGIFSEVKAAKELLSQAAAVIALNEDEAALLLELGCDGSKLTVVGNGVPDFAEPVRPAQLDAAVATGFMLQVGRITPIKRQLEVAKAAAYGRWPVVMAGSPDPGAAEYFTAVQRAGGNYLHVLSQSTYGGSELSWLYSNAGVLMLPSATEVMSLVLLEAAHFGLPTVTSRNIPVGPVPLALVTRIGDLDPATLLRAASEVRARAQGVDRGGAGRMQSWEVVSRALSDVYVRVLGNE